MALVMDCVHVSERWQEIGQRSKTRPIEAAGHGREEGGQEEEVEQGTILPSIPWR